MKDFCIYLLLVNLLAFFTSAYDKFCSKRRGMRRVPEKHLFLLAVLGGSVGLYLSFLLFRHKTRHRKFMVGVPLIFLAEVSAAFIIGYLLRR